MNLPVDFEQKVKLPAQVNGRSYPYQISARDLMQNYRYAALQVLKGEVNGVYLNELILDDGSRAVQLDGGIIAHELIEYPFQVFLKDQKWMMRYGYVYDNESSFLVDGTEFPTPNQYGVICIKIQRDINSRAIIQAEALMLEIEDFIPASTNEYQYIKIAELFRHFSVTQHRFEDIRLTEFMIAEAGELKLVSVFDTTNTYALP